MFLGFSQARYVGPGFFVFQAGRAVEKGDPVMRIPSGRLR